MVEVVVEPHMNLVRLDCAGRVLVVGAVVRHAYSADSMGVVIDLDLLSARVLWSVPPRRMVVIDSILGSWNTR